MASSPTNNRLRVMFAMLSLVVATQGCFLFYSDEERYNARVAETDSLAGNLCFLWDDHRKNEINYQLVDQELDDFWAEVKKTGLDWNRHGEPIAYERVVEKLERKNSVSAKDAWGSKFELRVVGNLLIVRSPGADKKFDGNFYTVGHTPWMEGGDIVLMRNGHTITAPEIPQSEDWFYDGDDTTSHFDRVLQTRKRAQFLSSSWSDVKAKELRSAAPLARELQYLKEKVATDGLMWSSLDDNVPYKAIGSLETPEMAFTPFTDDRWGAPLEFRTYGNLLLIRSSGTDKQFDGDFYTAGRTPWPGGGDIIVAHDWVITAPKLPKPWFWWFYGDYED